MHGNLYKPGDRIVVRTGILKSAQPKGSGEVIAVMPETRGVISYRVRFESENFERNISPDDIDKDASQRAGVEFTSSEETATSSWIKSSAIKVRK